jgi:DNA repair exonuclease SbcCD ATPase subunit
MKIKKVEWKNFASYGNRKQEIEFGETSNLYQIIGENGSGKSTISQVITFCLYGKIEGKKLKDIPNRINGSAWTRVTLDHFGTDVVVERGLEPNFFRIYINGSEYDQAGIKNVQDYLVDNILGIPYYVFNNTILLSINDFKSFIKMSPQDKRAIIDKIFGFHILNQMREILKGEIKKLKENSDLLGGKINSIEMSLATSLKEMEDLTSKIEEQSQNKLQELEKSLATFEDLQKVHGEKVTELRNREETLKTQITSTNQSLFDSKSKIKEVGRKLGLYESEKCPTCESDLNTDFHLSLKEELQKEKNRLSEFIDEAEKEFQNLISLKDSLDINKNEILEKGMKIKTRIETLRNEIINLKKESSNLQTESLQRIIKGLEENKDTLTVEKYQKEEKQTWFKSLDEILSEKGVKQMAIRTILPSLNSEIVELLRKMNLGYQVIFD